MSCFRDLVQKNGQFSKASRTLLEVMRQRKRQKIENLMVIKMGISGLQSFWFLTQRIQKCLAQELINIMSY